MTGNSVRVSAFVWSLAVAFLILPVLAHFLFSGSMPGLAASRQGVFPTVQSSLFQQFAAVASAFFLKPLYMLLSLLIIIALRRNPSPDMAALKWGMVVFLTGEGFCAINFLFLGGAHIAEYLHSAGMAAAFGFVAYAMLEGFDRRILHYTEHEKPCVGIDLCQTCARSSCGLRKLFLLLIPCIMLIGLLPLSVRLTPLAYKTVIFGTPYTYVHPLVYQIFEGRFCPMYGLVFLAVSVLITAAAGQRGVQAGKVLLAAGLGPLSFGLFRVVLIGALKDNLLWATFWEEFTEWLFVIGICSVLLTFRKTLLVASD